VGSEGVAEAMPAPDVISNIPDSLVQHRYEVSWRNASRLSNLLFQWALWHITLKYMGYADPKNPYLLEKPIRACILALCQHGWFDSNPNELLRLLPPLPSGPGLVQGRSVLLPGETLWFEDERFRERMAAFFDGNPLRDLRRQLADLLLLIEAEAPRWLSQVEDKARVSSILGETWITSTEARKFAEILGFEINDQKISKSAKADEFKNRESERNDGSRREVEINSFCKWLNFSRSKKTR
jgi:hypothetical protein